MYGKNANVSTLLCMQKYLEGVDIKKKKKIKVDWSTKLITF